MTKREKRNVIRGFLIVLILAGIYAGILVRQQMHTASVNRKEAEDAQKKVLLALDPEQIMNISFGKPGEPPVTLKKNENGYGSPDDPAFTASQERTSRMEKDLSDLEMSRKLDDADDLEKYGLKDPKQQIEITMADGEAHRILVGNHSDSEKELYIQVDEDPAVYLTKALLDEHFAGDLNALAEYEDFPEIRAEMIRTIEVSKEEDSFRLDTPGDDSCTVTDEDGSTQKADVGLAGTVQMNLSNLSWQKNVEYHLTEPEKYGLEKPAAEISIRMAGPDEDDLTEISMDLGDKDSSGNYYACLGESSQVHVIRGEYVESLINGKASDFWSRSYSFVSVGDLDHLEVTLDGEMHTLRAVSKEGTYTDEDMSWYVDEVPVPAELFKDFYYECVSVTAQERLTEVPEYEEEPELSLNYYLKDGTEKQLDYYAEDQNFYTVIYDNGTKAASTNRIYVSTMIESGRELIQAASGEMQ